MTFENVDVTCLGNANWQQKHHSYSRSYPTNSDEQDPITPADIRCKTNLIKMFLRNAQIC